MTLAIANSGHQAFADFSTSGSFSVNLNFDVAGSNLYLLIGVHHEDHGQSITDVVYDGGSILANLVAVGTHGAVSGTDGYVAVYELLAPATGTGKVITVTMTRASSGINAGIVSAVLFSDADQTTPRGAPASTGGIDVTAITRSPASAVGDIVVDFVSISRTDVTLVADGGQTELINVNSDHRCGVSHKAGAAGTTTMGWTWTPARRAGQVALAVKPATVSSFVDFETVFGMSSEVIADLLTGPNYVDFATTVGMSSELIADLTTSGEYVDFAVLFGLASQLSAAIYHPSLSISPPPFRSEHRAQRSGVSFSTRIKSESLVQAALDILVAGTPVDFATLFGMSSLVSAAIYHPSLSISPPPARSEHRAERSGVSFSSYPIGAKSEVSSPAFTLEMFETASLDNDHQINPLFGASLDDGVTFGVTAEHNLSTLYVLNALFVLASVAEMYADQTGQHESYVDFSTVPNVVPSATLDWLAQIVFDSLNTHVPSSAFGTPPVDDVVVAFTLTEVRTSLSRLLGAAYNLFTELQIINSSKFKGQVLDIADTTRVTNFHTARRLLRVLPNSIVQVNDVVKTPGGQIFLCASHGDGYMGNVVFTQFKLFELTQMGVWSRPTTLIDPVTGLDTDATPIPMGIIHYELEPAGTLSDMLNVTTEQYSVITNADLKIGDRLDRFIVTDVSKQIGVTVAKVGS